MDGVGDEVMGEGDEVYMGDREEGVDGVGDEVVGEGDEVHMGDGEEGTNGKKRHKPHRTKDQTASRL